VSGASQVLDRLRSFFSSSIWGDQPEGLSRARAAVHRVSRVAYSTVRGFFVDQLTSRAAALTYYTVLSIVPFLAFAFAVLKGFGAYRTFIDGTVRPWLTDNFAANPALYEAIDRILRFVDQTDVSKLGTLGLLFLVYTSVSLVSSVEVALNRTWGAKTERPFLRQVTDYVTLLVTTPLLLLVATGFSAAAQSSRVVVFLRETLGLGPVIDFVLGLTPVVVVWIALFAIYMILPNVRTRPASAALGAAVAAVLWQGALVLHVQSQVGVARYNALYSVLGALPIFLVWTWVSWLVVLVGAELAASHQNEQAVRQRFRAERVDQALKEVLAIAVAARVTQDFLAGAPRRSHAALAELLHIPLPVVEEVLDALVRSGLLARTVSGRELGYVPGRDVDAVRASELRDAVRRDRRGDETRRGVERRLGPGIRQVLHGFEEASRGSRFNLTLRELAHAAQVPDARQGMRAPAPPDVEREDDGGDRDDQAVDAKQPDVPA
jgi:membrane protein